MSTHTGVFQMNGHPITPQSNNSSEDAGGKKKPKSGEALTLLDTFLNGIDEVESYKNGKKVLVDGATLSIPAITAASRFNAVVELDGSPHVKKCVLDSRSVITRKVEEKISVYGVTTGVGGSADTRTSDTRALGYALVEHHYIGVLPSAIAPLTVLPLLDPLTSTSMPECWVRGAMVIRMNSLLRGHSGVRWELMEKMAELLRANITPLVPLRASISASGDLTPLSYVGGVLIGHPSLRVFVGPPVAGSRKIVSARQALKDHGITPWEFLDKEYLGMVNGTAFSASTGALVLNDAITLALFANVLTAMGTEAHNGYRGSFHPFIHEEARPHPGQVESARIIWDLLEGSTFAQLQRKECTIDEDNGELRQDRYPLRTAPQFIGPQIEDILHAFDAVTVELNSTTDNPLLDGKTGDTHHCGNFQAMAVSNAMEKTRLALHHIGKIMFAQSTELINPAMNGGLPPDLAATEPSLNFHAKGLDIATASFVSELGHLANPVTTHIQSAEMHNQAVNSLALISARATIDSLQVLSMLMATYLYAICQAFDLRALQRDVQEGLGHIVSDELNNMFGKFASRADLESFSRDIQKAMWNTFNKTSTRDAKDRMHQVASSCANLLLDFCNRPSMKEAVGAQAVTLIPSFQARVGERATQLLLKLRTEYLTGAKGAAPASRFLNKTRPVYEYVRLTLKVKMHGATHMMGRFEHGIGVEENTIGDSVTSIYEALRDGELQKVLAKLFR